MSKISAYAALTLPAAGDVLPVVDTSDTSMAASGTTKKITLANLLPGITVPPSGDTSGATDKTNIQNAINAATGPVYLTSAGTYTINAPLALTTGTVITGTSDGGFGGAFPPGVSEILLANGSNSSMFTAADGVNHWRLRNLLLSGNGSQQSGPAQTGTTGAAIHVADGASPAELQAELHGVYIQSPYNDCLYLGANRRSLHARDCKFEAAGTGTTVYGTGNGVTCNYSDHVFDACFIGGSRHHGIWLAPANASSIRITNCDIFTTGQDWTAITPTTVAAGSNGQAVSGLTAAGVLNVAAVTGFPAAGSLFINVSTGPVVVSYTGTSGGTQFTGVTVQAAQGNTGGTLATGQGVWIFGGNGVHIGSVAAGISVAAGNSLDRNNGSGIFVETSVNNIKIIGNRFLSNGQAATGLLPHINLITPNAQTAIIGNGMEPVASGATDQCNNFVYSNGAGSGWLDAANEWLFAQLSTSQYTNSATGPRTFSSGTFFAQSSNSGLITGIMRLLAGQTADLLEFQNSSSVVLAKVDTTGTYSVANGAGFTALTGSGQYLAAAQYAPATQAVLTTAAATMGAVSSANVNTGSFTAPASGTVVVTASFVSQSSAGGDEQAWGLCAHGTTTPMVCNTVTTKLPTTNPLPASLPFLVTGLTAGTSYNFDLMFAIASAGTLTVYAYGNTSASPGLGGSNLGGPVLMTVQAV